MVSPIGVVSLRTEVFHHRVALGVDDSGQCHDTHNSETLRMPILPSSCGDQMTSAYFRALCNYFMHYTFLIFMKCSKAVVSTSCLRNRRTGRCDNTFWHNLLSQSAVLRVGHPT
jgi:hypothetical protein